MSPLKIAVVYRSDLLNIKFDDMLYARWMEISKSFCLLGHEVDVIFKDEIPVHTLYKRNLLSRRLGFQYLSKVDWKKYDIIKAMSQRGFETVIKTGGESHPFIITGLGAVVGSSDEQGVFFYGKTRDNFFKIQKIISKRARCISFLTEANKRLWVKEFGNNKDLLIVPTGVPNSIPLAQKDPFIKITKKKRCIYVGNIYNQRQRRLNLIWQDRLNYIGKELKKRDIAFFFVGKGFTDRLNKDYVIHIESVSFIDIWDYHYFADVGIVLAQGEEQHNESSKIYYYLRAGLPVVSEEPIPNNYLIKESGLGFIAQYGNAMMMINYIEEAIHKRWDRKRAISYILENHTWDRRAKIYDDFLKGK